MQINFQVPLYLLKHGITMAMLLYVFLNILIQKQILTNLGIVGSQPISCPNVGKLACKMNYEIR